VNRNVMLVLMGMDAQRNVSVVRLILMAVPIVMVLVYVNKGTLVHIALKNVHETDGVEIAVRNVYV